MKVSYVMHKKGKEMVLEKSNKAPDVWNGTGKTQLCYSQGSIGSYISLGVFLNTEEEAVVVCWCLDG